LICINKPTSNPVASRCPRSWGCCISW